MPYHQLETSQKASIKGAIQFCRAKRIPYTQKELASIFKVSRNQIHFAIQSDTQRTKKRSGLKAWNKRNISERDLDRVELFLDNNAWDGHAINWAELVDQFGFNFIPQTLKEHMAKRSIYTFFPCAKPWINEKPARNWLSWAKEMFSKYPSTQDWRSVRFSDEVHFGWGPQGKQLIIRRRGKMQRGHPYCIQRLETREKGSNIPKVHFWGGCRLQLQLQITLG